MSRPFDRSLALVSAFVLSAALIGCPPLDPDKPDSRSGGDHQRDLARKIPLGRSVTDKVSAPAGDHTDWKYVQVPEPGTLTFRVRIDNPSVHGAIRIFDDLGEPMARQTVVAKQNLYVFEEPVEKAGRYFVEVAVRSYETVYSVENRFERRATTVVFEERPETDRPHHGGGGRKGGGGKPAPTEEQKGEEPDDERIISVTATIINRMPWKEGKATRLTFDRGSLKGVKRGGTVAISTGGTCVVKEVHESASVCFAAQPPSSFQEGTKVIIRSEK